MKKVEVIKAIIDILKKEGNITVNFIVDNFGVSEATARRYINELEKTSKSLSLKRVRGGLIMESFKSVVEPMFEMKLDMNKEEKKRIAKKAVELVEEPESLIIDSGTTAYYFAHELRRKKGLKVITVDLKVAGVLAENSEIETIIIGGNIRPGYYTLGGVIAEEVLKKFYVDKAFLTADAIDLEKGITNSSMFEVEIKRLIALSAKEVILLVDHTKINKRTFVKVVDLENIDILITDNKADKDFLSKLEEKGIKVFVV